ncbi:MAG: hypothetical protein LW629_11430 [Burkholderiales bacterium]|nr:hypothetical protein [Burkholderiales bacterium]
MTTPLHDQLDELQTKVGGLISHLMASRQSNIALRKHIESLEAENKQLKQKVEKTSGQVNQMLQQWFPEVTAEEGRSNGHA